MCILESNKDPKSMLLPQEVIKQRATQTQNTGNNKHRMEISERKNRKCQCYNGYDV